VSKQSEARALGIGLTTGLLLSAGMYFPSEPTPEPRVVCYPDGVVIVRISDDEIYWTPDRVHWVNQDGEEVKHRLPVGWDGEDLTDFINTRDRKGRTETILQRLDK